MPISNKSYHANTNCQQSAGFQLPNASITAAVQPGLWDGVDLAQFEATRPGLIEGYRPADRMLLALSLTEVSPTARIVAAALAFHGWSSWPSRDRLARMLRIHKRNVSRAMRELERAGAVHSFRRHRTSGSVEHVFGGQLLLAADAEIQTELIPCYGETQGVNLTPWRCQSDTRTGKEPERVTVAHGNFSQPLIFPTGYFQPGDSGPSSFVMASPGLGADSSLGPESPSKPDSLGVNA